MISGHISLIKKTQKKPKSNKHHRLAAYKQLGFKNVKDIINYPQQPLNIFNKILSIA